MSCFCRNFFRNKRGSVAVEFSILAPPFFLLTFAVLETAAVFIGELALENAVMRVGRTVRTGEVAQEQASNETIRNRLCSLVPLPIDCSKLSIDLRSYSSFSEIPSTIPMKDASLDADNMKYERGSPGQIMALRAFYEWPIHTDIMRIYLSNVPSGQHMLVAVDVFKTEPFQ
ncbi:TadE/TadG family type IV pilus assembly protein [Aurantimonas sp. Leaf443]|uniref:TadE/TadG family type IV pilus assembly protein n=1 Tax=Aurantimonas sp. Leaf443 TaxID=1736378 RepID=UPI0006FAAD4C|nr:TadE/TadG family type IV pilus assembly protein [Aurantimonas sp. Leaf443]KQT85765.1 hypothetical protein ASG48_03850 [Aurantimonas sp. Leaf443]